MIESTTAVELDIPCLELKLVLAVTSVAVQGSCEPERVLQRRTVLQLPLPCEVAASL